MGIVYTKPFCPTATDMSKDSPCAGGSCSHRVVTKGVLQGTKGG